MSTTDFSPKEDATTADEEAEMEMQPLQQQQQQQQQHGQDDCSQRQNLSAEQADGEGNCNTDDATVELNLPHQLQDSVQVGRASWDNEIEFLLTCIGYTVGFGIVLRFPYLCFKNGGVAFLIPYTIMMVIVGLPLCFLELSFGQFASLGPLTIWRVSPLFKGIGITMVTISVILSVYNNVLIAQCLYFLAASFTSRLPWQNCGNSWNTKNCKASLEWQLQDSSVVTNSSSAFMSSCSTFDSPDPTRQCKTPSEEFYESSVLQLTDRIGNFGSINWLLALALLIAWIVVVLVLLKGVQSLGKASIITAIFPYYMLFILLIRGATLPGAGTGVLYYLTPKWERLLDYKVWMEAATQIFFSLSCCNGGLIAMSSYNKFRNNCQRDAVLVALINCGTSVFVGFVVFCYIGFLSHQKGVSVYETVGTGPSLVFVVIPEALTHMPLAPLWSVLFFAMMSIVGFGCQFGLVETVFTAIRDELKSKGLLRASQTREILLRVGICSALFVLGLPMTFGSGWYLLMVLDSAMFIPLLVCGYLEIVVLMYIYTFSQFARDIKLMLGVRPSFYWLANWLVITPLVLQALILDTVGISFLYNNLFVHLLRAFLVALIPAYALYKFHIDGNGLSVYFLRPAADWGPAKPSDRREFLEKRLARNRQTVQVAVPVSQLSTAADCSEPQ